MGEEIQPEDIANTQKILGKYVNRPPLTDKLLKKPPFRFLHDVINTVIRETGFLKGLFTEGELLSDNVKDREAKVAFLNKLITAVKTITGTDLQVRASKIIAGLEPVETNKLLQAIGTAIDKKLDSKEYVSQLKGSKSKSKVKESDKTKKSTSKASVKSEKSSDSTRVKKSVETPKNATSKTKLATVKETPKKASKTEVKTRSSKDTNKTDVKKNAKKKDSPREAPKEKNISPRVAVKENKASPRAPSKEKIVSPRAAVLQPESPKAAVEVNNEAEIEQKHTEEITEKNVIEEVNDVIQESAIVATPVEEVKVQKSAERPKTASRPRSGNRMPPVAVVADLPAMEVSKPEKKMPEQPPIMRPKSSLRPPSVRPSSARPGAPRLRPDSALPLKEMIPLGKINVIVENFGDVDNKEDDEEETVVIQNDIEDVPDTISIEKSLDIPVDKGHLVEQILEQIQGPDQLEEAKEKNTWENDNIRGKDSTTKEINQLRASIQSLTRTANPLGKLMSYLHEDVEAMHSELDSWTNMKNQYTSEINVQRRANSESNQPLINQLQDLEENIKKQREEISNVKFNILRNEEKIRDLISKQVIVQ